MPHISDYLEVPRFRQVFDLVVSGYHENLPPRIADLTRALGRTASSVHNQVRLLQKAGYIELVGGSNRTRAVLLTDEGIKRATLSIKTSQGPAELKAVSLNLDVIPGKCGFRRIGEGELQEFSISHLFPRWRGDDLDHLILAENDSMIAPEGRSNPKSIYPSDVVHCRDGLAPGNRDRVYIEYSLSSGERECALKIMERKGKDVVLHSLNPDYPPVTVVGDDISRCYVVLDVITRVR